MKSKNRNAALAAVVLAWAAGTGPAGFAAETVFNAASGVWSDPANWTQSGGVHVVPGTADAAVIFDGSTVDLSSIESVSEVQISTPANNLDTSTIHGVARLNVLSGAVLTTSNSSGIRVGRALDSGQAVGTSRGEIHQSGGTVLIATGANGLRLSAAETPSADSLYVISGGQLRGGPAGTGPAGVVSDLRIGATGSTWGTAEFRVVGNGTSEIAVLDLQMAGSVSGNGTSILHFTIVNGLVTPITVADELQFRGTGGDSAVFGSNLLQIEFDGAPVIGQDITLINADRLNTNGVTNSPSLERFTGMPEGTLVVREIEGATYTYALRYVDGTDNGVLDARVYLQFVSVPEPSSMAVVGAGAMGLLMRVRRRAGMVGGAA